MSFRRLLLLGFIVSLSFIAGLVLTGRLRSADQAEARPTAADAQAAGPVRANDPVRTVAPPAVAPPGPDFTGVAAQTINAVTNISSLQFVRAPAFAVHERSVLPVLLRRSGRVRRTQPP